jgi:hypothetical protein
MRETKNAASDGDENVVYEQMQEHARYLDRFGPFACNILHPLWLYCSCEV